MHYIILILIFLVFIVAFNRRMINKQTSKSKESAAGFISLSENQNNPFNFPENHEINIMPIINSNDSLFNTNHFIAFAKSVFSTYYQALSEGSLMTIRPLLHDDFFHNRQKSLTNFIENNYKIIFKPLKIYQAYLHLYERNVNEETLTVFLTADIVQYTTDLSSEEIVDGNENDVLHAHYFLVFLRKRGVKTKCMDHIPDNCPHCGASIQADENGKCVSCHTPLTTGDVGWVLRDLHRIVDFTDFDEHGVILDQ